MEALQLHGIDPAALTYSELLDNLGMLPSVPLTLKTIRSELFKSAKRKGLVDPGDNLVNRKHTAINLLEKKLADDIAQLILCNGKRCRVAFEKSFVVQTQPSQFQSNDPVTPTPFSPSNPTLVVYHPKPQLLQKLYFVNDSVVSKELTRINRDIQKIMSDVRSLQKCMSTIP